MKKVKIHVKKVDGLKLPHKANPKDAAYDVYATSEPKIVGVEIGGGIYSDIDYIEYGTNLFIAPQPSYNVVSISDSKMSKSFHESEVIADLTDWWVQGLPRSSISKYNLLIPNSCPTVDNPYRGEIKIRFKYYIQMSDIMIFDDGRLGARVNLDKCYRLGDRICQIRPVENVDIDWLMVDVLDETVRGEGGFGSSGQK